MDVILKRFESPDETRTFERGKFEIVRIGGMTLGRATYEPGWRWSEHVGSQIGEDRCQVEHVGLTVIEMRTGDVFYVSPGPPGHDSWVVGDEPYVSLHVLGATEYAER